MGKSVSKFHSTLMIVLVPVGHEPGKFPVLSTAKVARKLLLFSSPSRSCQEPGSLALVQTFPRSASCRQGATATTI